MNRNDYNIMKEWLLWFNQIITQFQKDMQILCQGFLFNMDKNSCRNLSVIHYENAEYSASMCTVCIYIFFYLFIYLLV